MTQKVDQNETAIIFDSVGNWKKRKKNTQIILYAHANL